MEFADFALRRKDGVSGFAFLVVEGPDDMRLLDAHADSRNVSIVIGNGKKSVLDCLKKMNDTGFLNILGLVDSDGDGPSIEEQIENVVTTELYDLDAEILRYSKVAERVFLHNCHVAKLRQVDLRDLDARLEDIVRDISVLRQISKAKGWDLSFRELSLHYLYDGSTRKLNRAKLVSKLTEKNSKISPSQIELALDAALSSGEEWYRFMSGHDLAKAYAIVLYEDGDVRWKADTVEKAFRSALWPGEFHATSIYTRIARWATARRISIWEAA